MNKMTINSLTLLLLLSLTSFGQHLGMTFQQAEKQGIAIKQLDSIYKSAVHTDAALAVFKTEKEQEQLQQSYVKLLQDLGKFLSDNHFNWEKPTRCFNRIYFSPKGTIDYFLYNFRKEEALAPEKEALFNKLLNAFIKDYTFGLTAKEKFAQCSPTTYKPK